MAGYVYRGSEFDAHIRPECGTRAGYKLHQRRNEKSCQPCKTANTEYTTEWERRTNKRKIYLGFTVTKCGTQAGYAAHKYHKIPLCDPCREANRAYNRAYKAAKKAAA
jgi:hypothetical protein